MTGQKWAGRMGIGLAVTGFAILVLLFTATGPAAGVAWCYDICKDYSTASPPYICKDMGWMRVGKPHLDRQGKVLVVENHYVKYGTTYEDYKSCQKYCYCEVTKRIEASGSPVVTFLRTRSICDRNKAILETRTRQIWPLI
jgi:hypothetical protein